MPLLEILNEIKQRDYLSIQKQNFSHSKLLNGVRWYLFVKFVPYLPQVNALLVRLGPYLSKGKSICHRPYQMQQKEANNKIIDLTNT
jgi:hypothetical protein